MVALAGSPRPVALLVLRVVAGIRAGHVINFPLFFIGQTSICGIYFFEGLGGLGCTVFIGVEFQRELSVRLFQLILGRTLFDAEHLIVIFFGDDFLADFDLGGCVLWRFRLGLWLILRRLRRGLRLSLIASKRVQFVQKILSGVGLFELHALLKELLGLAPVLGRHGLLGDLDAPLSLIFVRHIIFK